MRICTLASSSSGNCTIVSNDNIHLLLDTGISLRRIRDGLRSFSLSPGDLSGVLITHSHVDHISGLSMLLKYHKVPVFCSYGTGCGIISGCPEAAPFLNIFDVGSEFDLGGLIVSSFSTLHDAADSVGFTLSANGVKLAYVTDLGCVTDEVVEASLGANIAIIEANHDEEMLRRGSYPPFLKRRILSARGHLANSDCARLAIKLAGSNMHFAQLSHLSLENNTPDLAWATVHDALESAGFKTGVDFELDVAPHGAMSRVYDI